MREGNDHKLTKPVRTLISSCMVHELYVTIRILSVYAAQSVSPLPFADMNLRWKGQNFLRTGEYVCTGLVGEGKGGLVVESGPKLRTFISG